MLKNTKKTEVVTQDCDISSVALQSGFCCPKEVKYLGCQVGFSPNYRTMWEKILAKMQAASDVWSRKSASIGDRVLLVKTMVLSKLWYHGSVTPVPSDLYPKIRKIVESFVWAHKPHKVGCTQM
jgi:hypothetical protein